MAMPFLVRTHPTEDLNFFKFTLPHPEILNIVDAMWKKHKKQQHTLW
jgi:hypothetical protein